jgi:hypothetical protein
VWNLGRDDLLFSKVDSFSVQDHRRKLAESEIAGIDGDQLLNTNVDDLVSYIVDRFRIDVPLLDEANMNVDQYEARRDLSGDPMRRAFYSEREPLHVTGTEIEVEVPFSGDSELFKVRPSTYDTNPPSGDVRGDTVTFRCWGENLNSAQVRSQLDRWLADVNRWLQWQRAGFNRFNDSLPSGGKDSYRAETSEATS